MTERFIRVLLIDDNEDDFVQTRRLLQSARFDRFQLEWTPRFDEGLDALKGQKFDAYLIDYRIGERAGLDLVRAAVAAGCVAPMILLTGANADGLTLDALLAGSSDYLDKTRLDEYALEHSLRGAIDRALHFEELQKSEERFRALVENLSDGIKRLGQDGTNPLRQPVHHRDPGLPGGAADRAQPLRLHPSRGQAGGDATVFRMPESAGSGHPEPVSPQERGRRLEAP
jgi:CheY-like chemotaxis protein